MNRREMLKSSLGLASGAIVASLIPVEPVRQYLDIENCGGWVIPDMKVLAAARARLKQWETMDFPISAGIKQAIIVDGVNVGIPGVSCIEVSLDNSWDGWDID